MHFRPYGLKCKKKSVHIPGLTAWDVYAASQGLRPDLQFTGPARKGWTSMHFRPYGLKCKRKRKVFHFSVRPHLPGRKAWKMLVLALRPANEKKKQTGISILA